MTFAQRKLLVLAAWAGTVITVGFILGIDKPELWVVVATLAILPAVVGNWLWIAPEATLLPIPVKARSRS